MKGVSVWFVLIRPLFTVNSKREDRKTELIHHEHFASALKFIPDERISGQETK